MECWSIEREGEDTLTGSYDRVKAVSDEVGDHTY